MGAWYVQKRGTNSVDAREKDAKSDSRVQAENERNRWIHTARAVSSRRHSYTAWRTREPNIGRGFIWTTHKRRVVEFEEQGQLTQAEIATTVGVPTPHTHVPCAGPTVRARFQCMSSRRVKQLDVVPVCTYTGTVPTGSEAIPDCVSELRLRTAHNDSMEGTP